MSTPNITPNPEVKDYLTQNYSQDELFGFRKQLSDVLNSNSLKPEQVKGVMSFMGHLPLPSDTQKGVAGTSMLDNAYVGTLAQARAQGIPEATYYDQSAQKTAAAYNSMWKSGSDARISPEQARQFMPDQLFTLKNEAKAAAGPLSLPIEGASDVLSGAKQYATSFSKDPVLQNQERLQAGTKVIQGGMEMFSPAIGVGAAQAPLTTASYLIGAQMAQEGSSYTARKMGASPETQEFVGAVGGALPIGALAGHMSRGLPEDLSSPKAPLSAPIKPVPTEGAYREANIIDQIAPPKPIITAPTTKPKVTQFKSALATLRDAGLTSEQIGAMTPEQRGAKINELKGQSNAIQEPSPSSVLPHPQETAPVSGSERSGVGPSIQGEETSGAREQKVWTTDKEPIKDEVGFQSALAQRKLLLEEIQARQADGLKPGRTKTITETTLPALEQKLQDYATANPDAGPRRLDWERSNLKQLTDVEDNLKRALDEHEQATKLRAQLATAGRADREAIRQQLGDAETGKKEVRFPIYKIQDTAAAGAAEQTFSAAEGAQAVGKEVGELGGSSANGFQIWKSALFAKYPEEIKASYEHMRSELANGLEKSNPKLAAMYKKGMAEGRPAFMRTETRPPKWNEPGIHELNKENLNTLLQEATGKSVKTLIPMAGKMEGDAALRDFFKNLPPEDRKMEKASRVADIVRQALEHVQRKKAIQIENMKGLEVEHGEVLDANRPQEVAPPIEVSPEPVKETQPVASVEEDLMPKWVKKTEPISAPKIESTTSISAEDAAKFERIRPMMDEAQQAEHDKFREAYARQTGNVEQEMAPVKEAEVARVTKEVKDAILSSPKAPSTDIRKQLTDIMKEIEERDGLAYEDLKDKLQTIAASTKLDPAKKQEAALRAARKIAKNLGIGHAEAEPIILETPKSTFTIEGMSEGDKAAIASDEAYANKVNSPSLKTVQKYVSEMDGTPEAKITAYKGAVKMLADLFRANVRPLAALNKVRDAIARAQEGTTLNMDLMGGAGKKLADMVPDITNKLGKNQLPLGDQLQASKLIVDRQKLAKLKNGSYTSVLDFFRSFANGVRERFTDKFYGLDPFPKDVYTKVGLTDPYLEAAGKHMKEVDNPMIAFKNRVFGGAGQGVAWTSELARISRTASDAGISDHVQAALSLQSYIRAAAVHEQKMNFAKEAYAQAKIQRKQMQEDIATGTKPDRNASLTLARLVQQERNYRSTWKDMAKQRVEGRVLPSLLIEPYRAVMKARGYDNQTEFGNRVARVEFQSIQKELGDYDPEKLKTFNQIMVDFKKIGDEVWDFMHNSGLISTEMHAKKLNLPGIYATMARIQDYGMLPKNEVRPLSSTFKVERGKVLYDFKGSDLPTKNPIDALYRSAVVANAVGQKNMAVKAWIDTMSKNVGFNPMDIGPGYRMRLIESERDLNPGEAMHAMFRDGQKEQWALPADQAYFLQSANPVEIKTFANAWLQKSAMLLRSGATTAQIGFTTINEFRHALLGKTIGASSQMKSLDFFTHWINNFNSAWTQDSQWRAYMKSYANANTVQHFVGWSDAEPGIFPARDPEEWGVTHAMYFPFRTVMKFGKITQDATRMAGWQQQMKMIDTGKVPNKEWADFIARTQSGTPDFADSGRWSPYLNTLTMFLSAKWSYMDQMWNASRGAPYEQRAAGMTPRFWKMAAFTAATSYLLYRNNMSLKDKDGKPAYLSVSDLDRQGNMIIMTPYRTRWSTGRDPYFYAKVPVSTPMRIINNMVQDGLMTAEGHQPARQGILNAAAEILPTHTKIHAGKEGQDLMSGFTGTLNPTLQIGIGLATNKSPGTGAQIEHPAEQMMEYPDRFDPTTSIAIKKAARSMYEKGGGLEGIGRVPLVGHMLTSPAQLEFAYKTMTGTVGQSVLDTLDSAVKSTSKTLSPQEKVGKSLPEALRTAPVVGLFARRVIGGALDQREKDLEKDFYDTREAYNQRYVSLLARKKAPERFLDEVSNPQLDEVGNPSLSQPIQEFLKDPEVKAAAATNRYMTKIDQRLASIRKAQKQTADIAIKDALQVQKMKALELFQEKIKPLLGAQ